MDLIVDLDLLAEVHAYYSSLVLSQIGFTEQKTIESL
jgi:hypothetical protein